jgi:hypothetical protein
MALIPMPEIPSPASFEFEPRPLVGANTNPFTGQQQIQDWQYSYLEASVSLPAMPQAQAQAWVDFLISLRGKSNTFQFPDALVAAYPESLTTDGSSPRIWRLLKNDPEWSIRNVGLYGVTFEIREAGNDTTVYPPPPATSPPTSPPTTVGTVLLVITAQYNQNPAGNSAMSPGVTVPGESWYGLNLYTGGPLWNPPGSWLPYKPWPKTTMYVDISAGGILDHVAPPYQWKSSGYAVIFDIFTELYPGPYMGELWIYDVYVEIIGAGGSSTIVRPTSAAIVGNSGNALSGSPPAGNTTGSYVQNPGNAIDGDPDSYTVVGRNPAGDDLREYPNLKVIF